MPILTREAILAAEDLCSEEVEVPEWGGVVIVRALTARQRDQFEESMVTVRKGRRKMNLDDFRAKLCAICMVDEGGNRLFSDRDVESLGGKSAGAMQRVFNVAARLSGLSAEDVEELTGNSDGGARAALPSD